MVAAPDDAAGRRRPRVGELAARRDAQAAVVEEGALAALGDEHLVR